MRNQSRNVTRPSSLVQDRGQSLDDIVKEDGRERITLTHPAPIAEVIPNISIDGNSSLAPRDQTQGPMDPRGLKALAQKNLTEEGPVHPIIGFLKVQLQENSPKFPGLGFVDDLLEGEDPLMDMATLDERRLRPTNSPMGNRRESGSISLSNEFEDNVNQSNRPKLFDVLRPGHFRNQREDPKIEPRNVNSPQSLPIGDVHDERFHQMLEAFEEGHRKTIRPLGSIHLHARKNRINLFPREDDHEDVILPIRHLPRCVPEGGGKV
jgi:hypothetical protein